MARKPIPRGADGNLFSWMGQGILPRTEENKIQARISSAGIDPSMSKNRYEIERAIGGDKMSKFEKARYDWLFDDLQQFTSVDADKIETKEQLKEFVEATVGRSVGFESMKNKAPRRYQSSINRFTDSLWKANQEDIKQNVVTPLNRDKATEEVKAIKNPQSRKKLLSDATKKNLWLIRREQIIARRVDKRGRTYYMDARTGRRSRDPRKILEELGLI